MVATAEISYVEKTQGQRQAELAKREERMRQNFQAAEQFAEDLLAIRDQGLWRDGWASFAEYLSERWQLKKGTVYGQLAHAEAVRDIQGDSSLPSPTSERQTRPLRKLTPELKREAWGKAVEKSGGNVPTRETVLDVVHEMEDRGQNVVRIARREGIIPEGVEVEVVLPDPDPEKNENEPDSPLDLTDEQYLKQFDNVRDRLAVHLKAYFDADALAWRRMERLREEYRKDTRAVFDPLVKSFKGHMPPFIRKHRTHFLINGPGYWRFCSACDGNGRGVAGICAGCWGNGYYL